MIAHIKHSAVHSLLNTSDNNHTGNESLLDESCNHFANWTSPLIWVELCVMSFVIILNLLGLVSLSRPNQYINPPFKIYIGNLLLANISYAILENPLIILYELSCDRWIMSWAVCDLFIYSNYALTAWAMHAHVLITFNRLWAVVFPYSYRWKHSLTVAIVLCCGAFVYVNVWILPGVVMDSKFYRSSMQELSCELNNNAQRQWATATQICLFLAPIGFVAISYIFIVVKLRAQSKPKVKPASRGRIDDMALTVKRQSFIVQNEKHSNETRQVNGPNSSNTKQTGQNKTFFILTSLTCSLIITWTPYEVHQTLDLMGFSTPDELNEGLDILWTAQAVLDPLLSTYLVADIKRICGSLLGK